MITNIIEKTNEEIKKETKGESSELENKQSEKKKENKRVQSTKPLIFTAVRVSGKGNDVTIENCLLSGGFGTCVLCTEQGKLNLRGNKIFESRGNGVSFYGDNVCGVLEDNDIVDNYVSMQAFTLANKPNREML